MQIYLHIPFCKRKCLYCDFNSYANCSHELIFGYLTALNREIELAGKVWGKSGKNEKITSIFIGGGTPSLLAVNEVKNLFENLKKHFEIRDDAEITIEANPESVTEEKLAAYKSCGVNRLSLGVQSLDDRNLKAVVRIHDVETAKKAVNLARKYFDNLSCDLIVGLPYDTIESVKSEVETLAKAVDHLSVYQLILEEGTPLYEMAKEGKISLPDDDETIDLFNAANKTLKNLGFERYEVSNFAKAGKYSRHNFGYWMREEYIGIGAGASSFLKPENPTSERRFESKEDVEEYIASVESAADFFDIQRSYVEDLTADEIEDEKIMLGLRTSRGVEKELIGAEALEKYGKYFEEVEGRIRLTDAGFDVMNAILVDILKLESR